MRLLFATSIIPDASRGSGYEIASAAVIDALREAGADVTVAGYLWPEQPMPAQNGTIVLGRLDPRTDGASLGKKLGWLAHAVRLGLPFASAKLHDVSPEAFKGKIAAHGPFDAYVLNGAQFAAAFEPVFRDKPRLFVAHNVEHRSAQENAEAATSVVERTLFAREARLLRDVEQRLCRQSAFVFTLAEEDRAALGLSGDRRSATLPLTTRSELHSAPAGREITCDMALIGTWTWAPNRIGLEWFLREVLPLLPAGLRIRVAGHVPADLPPAFPQVDWAGRVADATEFVRSAAVIPLVSRAGTGVQLKTIETFELGLPSVATTHSLRGIGFLPANCTVADEPARFAEALQAAMAHRAADADGSAFAREQRRLLVERVGRALRFLRGDVSGRAAA